MPTDTAVDFGRLFLLQRSQQAANPQQQQGSRKAYHLLKQAVETVLY